MINQSERVSDASASQLHIWHPLIQQKLFKGLLHSFSYPGRIVEVSDAGALVSALATLVDQGLPLADPDNLLDELVIRRLGCRIAPCEEAAFVVCDGSRPPRFTPRLGSLDSPEHGATVIVAVKGFSGNKHYRLRGPGIADTTTLPIDGLNEQWIRAHQRWRIHYPMGADLLLVSDDCWVALPRTLTILEEAC